MAGKALGQRHAAGIGMTIGAGEYAARVVRRGVNKPCQRAPNNRFQKGFR
jgi:hypothetical protein